MRCRSRTSGGFPHDYQVDNQRSTPRNADAAGAVDHGLRFASRTALSSTRALVLAMNWEGRDVLWALVFQAYMASPVQGLGLGASAFVLRLHLPGLSNPVVHNDYRGCWPTRASSG